MIIELDGGHNNSLKGNVNDKERTKYLEKYGYRIIRFWNNEVIEDLDSVLEFIVSSFTPHSALFREERGNGRN